VETFFFCSNIVQIKVGFGIITVPLFYHSAKKHWV